MATKDQKTLSNRVANDWLNSNASIDISDVFPPTDHVQCLYCDLCKGHLDLAYADFSKSISGIAISYAALPVLRCEACGRDHIPDRSRLAIIEIHRQAVKKNSPVVNVTRHKPSEKFNFTSVPFLYDSDDYRYIPGLERPFNQGFLTPLFFNKTVLLKYEASPDYSVRFDSTTYGKVICDTFSIAFGINKKGRLMMWLGDVAALPESEQYYLKSENVESDHSIGSEFYEGQIDCIFTEPTKENRLFALRSEFVDACLERFGTKIAHLDHEVFNLALEFNAPVVDTEKERRHVADSLNKIYLESLDNAALGSLMKKAGGDPKNLGSLKRLQAVLEPIAGGADIPKLLSPMYVLYDIRVAYSHLTSTEKSREILKTVTARLSIDEASNLVEIYRSLLEALLSSYEKLTSIVKPPSNE
jgi:hypothetical protein